MTQPKTIIHIPELIHAWWSPVAAGTVFVKVSPLVREDDWEYVQVLPHIEMMSEYEREEIVDDRMPGRRAYFIEYRLR